MTHPHQMTPMERFEAKFIPEPNSGCWIWTGAIWARPGGDRGKIVVNGKQAFAYRVSYELFVGPIPDGLLICHKCDTPLCVNPDHLFAGTPTDNMRDMLRKGRGQGGRTRGGLGVSRHGESRWKAYAKANGKQLHLGVFRTIEEARAARLAFDNAV